MSSLMETGLTKNQHYVPRFYLKAWADDNDFLWAKIDGQIRHVNILNIAQEKYFYRYRPISLDELKYIFEFQKKHYKGTRLKTNLTYVAGSVFPIILQRHLEAGSSDELQEMFALIQNYLPFSLKENTPKYANILKYTIPKDTDGYHDQQRAINDLIRNGLEKMCCEVESSFWDILEQLRKGVNIDNTFSLDQQEKILYFFAFQYFRTLKFTNTLERLQQEIHADTINIENMHHCMWLCYIEDLYVGLWERREAYKLLLLKNDTSETLLTSDQPIINLGNEDNSLDMYYPISPNRFIVLTTLPDKYNFGDTVSEDCITQLNSSMSKNSMRQVYASNQEDLRRFSSVVATEL